MLPAELVNGAPPLSVNVAGVVTPQNPPVSADPEIRGRTSDIIDSVRRRGDDALRQMAAKYDCVDLDSLEVPRADWRRCR